MWHRSSFDGVTWNRKDSENEASPDDELSDDETEDDDGFDDVLQIERSDDHQMRIQHSSRSVWIALSNEALNHHN